jgi:hypothetical protein
MVGVRSITLAIRIPKAKDEKAGPHKQNLLPTLGMGGGSRTKRQKYGFNLNGRGGFFISSCVELAGWTELTGLLALEHSIATIRTI